MAKLLHATGTFVDFDAHELEQSIPRRFEAQAAKRPSHLAIETRKHTLSYEQLNSSANVIAREILNGRGKGSEPIALLLENDAPMIEAILGVLKAGKIYIPLDPSLPSSRLSYILQDTEAGLLITNDRNAELATSLTGGKVEFLDLDDLDRQAGEDNPGICIPPDSPTWIIYTSGSTGHPKGVIQTHRNVIHYVRNYTNGLFLSSSDRLSLLYSFAVNGAAHEMFSGLLNGASLHPLDVKKEGFSAISDWLIDQQVTTYSSVPTVFRHFCETLTGVEKFPNLRFIKMIGEAVSKKDVDLYQKHFSRDTIFINRLGSTETGSIRWHFIDKDTRIEGTSVPVGYPVPDNEVMLLDENRKQVAEGEVGEIAVRSRYLSLGYWRKPEQTTKVFINDEEGGDQRTYLTGDMGRFLPDGCLVHMGRKDFQVKIRGNRIETAEIETALVDIAKADEVIVMARDDGKGESRLVAYLLMRGRPRHSVTVLRRELAARLPSYMIPSAFMMLDSFPVAPNGKVNRGALPLPDSSRPELENPFVAPSNLVEQQIAKMWSGLLSIDTVGIHDDFFDLGGNSILAVQLMVAIGKTFGRQLLPAAIFQAPTIGQISQLLQQKGDSSLPSIIPLRPEGSGTPFFWIHGDSGNASLLDYLDPEQPVYGLEHQSQDGQPAKYLSVETIAEYYLRQIREIQPQGPYLLGGYSFGGTIAFEAAQNLTKQGERISLLAMLDSAYPSSTPPGSANRDENSEAPESEHPLDIHSHLQKLAKLGFMDRVRYLQVRFKNRLNGLIGNRLRRNFKWLQCKVSLKAGWKLPASVRSYYILEVYKRARSSYSPHVFPGPAIYFKSTKQSTYHRDSWQKLMRELEVYEVPGDHMDLIKRENVPHWARTLGCCVAKAQTLDTSPRSILPADRLTG
jgi:amino acid adenylation domain-containing protein